MLKEFIFFIILIFLLVFCVYILKTKPNLKLNLETLKVLVIKKDANKNSNK